MAFVVAQIHDHGRILSVSCTNKYTAQGQRPLQKARLLHSMRSRFLIERGYVFRPRLAMHRIFIEITRQVASKNQMVCVRVLR